MNEETITDDQSTENDSAGARPFHSPRDDDGGWTVAHLLGPLHPSGAEVMLLVAAERFTATGATQVVISLAAEDQSSITSRFERSGLEVVHVGGMSRWRSVLRYLKVIRLARPTVVHVHAEGASMATSLIPRLFRVRVVRTIHNNFQFTRVLRQRKRLERTICRIAGVRFVAISPSVADNELQRFSNRTTLIMNWFDDQTFLPPTQSERERARGEFDLPPDRLAVAVVGNCSPVKNHELLLQSVSRLQPDSRPFILHAGRETSDHHERLLAEELGIIENVRFIGPTENVVRVLHAADAFVMPSIYEGIGVAGLEAAATGLPLLVADSPGLRDLSLLGPHVRLHQLDAGSLASALRDVTICEAEDSRRGSLAGRAIELFGADRAVAEYLEIYGIRPAMSSAS